MKSPTRHRVSSTATHISPIHSYPPSLSLPLPAPPPHRTTMLDPEQQNPPTPNHPPPSSSHPPIYVPRKRQTRKKQQQLSPEANPKDLAAAYPEQGLPSTPSEPPETPAKATLRKKNVRKKKQQQQVEPATPISVDTTDADPLHQETGDATVPQPVPRKRVRKKAQSQSQQQAQQQPQQQQPPAQPTPSPQLPSSILAPHELDASDMDLMQDLDDAGYTQQQHTLQRTTRRKRDRPSSDAPEEVWDDFGKHEGYAGVFEEQEDEAPEEEEEASPKKKRKRTKEPGAPKKNLNGYMFFVSKRRSEAHLSFVAYGTRRRQIMDENPGLNLQGYGKVLGQTWRNMTEEEKKVKFNSDYRVASRCDTCVKRNIRFTRASQSRPSPTTN
ncbi:hypothetical protein BC938DRAFT_471688 [Jimgerdemannia flammicorona]|uniref:HMG box domain-containing protein n=1 Tax=Jimgerdemannia flammicorona TaxID=994334 RepID=A0A433Q7M1_9FUNG|nr:hypothetical protein BC938DRAFT_471688 [Jimgerdemannia flammicorona]